MRREVGFADQVAQGRGTAQTSGAMEQSSHEARLRAGLGPRKMGQMERNRRMLDAPQRSVAALAGETHGWIFADRYQQFIYESGVCFARADDRAGAANRDR